jgi:hypothetical protein
VQAQDNVSPSSSLRPLSISLVRLTGPGERIARMELAVMLGTTLHQFRIELSDPAVELRSAAKLLLSPADDIPATIRFIPRGA